MIARPFLVSCAIRRCPRSPPACQHVLPYSTTPRLTHHGAAEFPARNRSRQRVIADRDLLVDKLVRKVVRAARELLPRMHLAGSPSRHGADEDGDRVRFWQRGQELRKADGWRVGGQRWDQLLASYIRPRRLTKFDGVGGEVVGDWVLPVSEPQRDQRQITRNPP